MNVKSSIEDKLSFIFIKELKCSFKRKHPIYPTEISDYERVTLLSRITRKKIDFKVIHYFKTESVLLYIQLIYISKSL